MKVMTQLWLTKQSSSPVSETGITAGKNIWKEKAIDLNSNIYITKISYNTISEILTFSILFSTTEKTGKFSCHSIVRKEKMDVAAVKLFLRTIFWNHTVLQKKPKTKQKKSPQKSAEKHKAKSAQIYTTRHQKGLEAAGLLGHHGFWPLISQGLWM